MTELSLFYGRKIAVFVHEKPSAISATALYFEFSNVTELKTVQQSETFTIESPTSDQYVSYQAAPEFTLSSHDRCCKPSMHCRV